MVFEIIGFVKKLKEFFTGSVLSTYIHKLGVGQGDRGAP